MIRLETKNKEQELLKAYLEANASKELADKINNGVKIVKDGKTLINKKTLYTFMSYATEEARKQFYNRVEEIAHQAALQDSGLTEEQLYLYNSIMYGVQVAVMFVMTFISDKIRNVKAVMAITASSAMADFILS